MFQAASEAVQQRGQSQGDDSTGDSSDLSDGWHTGLNARSPDVASSEDAAEHDVKLSRLEERIRDWLRKDNPRIGPKVAQLRRLTVQVMWCVCGVVGVHACVCVCVCVCVCGGGVREQGGPDEGGGWLRKDNPRIGPKVAQLWRLTVQVMWSVWAVSYTHLTLPTNHRV